MKDISIILFYQGAQLGSGRGGAGQKHSQTSPEGEFRLITGGNVEIFQHQKLNLKN